MSRQQWEYMEMTIGDGSNLRVLDGLGREGWEAYATNIVSWEREGYTQSQTIFYLKRPIQEEQEEPNHDRP